MAFNPSDSTLYNDKRFWVGDKDGIVIVGALSEIHGSQEIKEIYGTVYGPFFDRDSAMAAIERGDIEIKNQKY